MFLESIIHDLTKVPTPLLILIGFFAVCSTWMFAYFVLRRMKGSVRFELPRPYRYQAGEMIKGVVHIKVAKPCTADVVKVTITATTTTTGSKNQSRTVTHYRDQTVIAERVTLSGVGVSAIHFELQLPQTLSLASEIQAQQMAKILGTNPVLEAFGSMISIAGADDRKRLKWDLTVDVEMPGIDLVGVSPVDVAIIPAPEVINVPAGSL